jgi:hypothetical protein
VQEKVRDSFDGSNTDVAFIEIEEAIKMLIACQSPYSKEKRLCANV